MPAPPALGLGQSGALARGSQHYVSLLVNQVISKVNEAYSPLCPRDGVRGFILTGALAAKHCSMLFSSGHNRLFIFGCV